MMKREITLRMQCCKPVLVNHSRILSATDDVKTLRMRVRE